MAFKLNWVGKYLLGAAAAHVVTAPLRNKRTQAQQVELSRLTSSFQEFNAKRAAEFLMSETWEVDQIPCCFQTAEGKMVLFVYEPGCPEKLTEKELNALSEFIDCYGMNALKSSLELSRDRARSEAICFMWHMQNDTTHIDEVSSALSLLNSI